MIDEQPVRRTDNELTEVEGPIRDRLRELFGLPAEAPTEDRLAALLWGDK